MEPNELSEEVLKAVARAQSRVDAESIGAQQYHVEGQPQKFESMPVDDFFEMYLEEIDDIINYGVMLSIKMTRLRVVWQHVERMLEDAGSFDQSNIDPGIGAGHFIPSGPPSPTEG